MININFNAIKSKVMCEDSGSMSIFLRECENDFERFFDRATRAATKAQSKILNKNLDNISCLMETLGDTDSSRYASYLERKDTGIEEDIFEVLDELRIEADHLIMLWKRHLENCIDE